MKKVLKGGLSPKKQKKKIGKRGKKRKKRGAWSQRGGGLGLLKGKRGGGVSTRVGGLKRAR